ncbi:MAG: cytochrome c oxidase subunit II [Alphaproteobacteria bacterium 64-6]|nr:cytochrome c oxidase subunit II [Hyphomicrobium sp.]MBN9264387.1 cytochrome c oxidase subunit II [Hyphomicrobium sp.]OJU27923.1 MAG: cytochrome c oxidase subunit II [Alphaproteobacteria bacterium 64-6]
MNGRGGFGWAAKLAARAGSVASGMALVGGATSALAQTTGQPMHWQMGLQAPVTPIADAIHWFHDVLVNPIIIGIAAFVLVLMIYVMYKFSEKRNPTPSSTTHNQLLEVAWTVIPVLILLVIAVPSFKLLYAQYDYPKPDLTIKATGNQWNWTHSYPDHGNFSFTSVMLNDQERQALIAKGIPAPRLLAVNNEVFVPVNKVVHVLVTASDVIHNWTIPSFGSKVDAVPGRITATWFKARKEGVYYGQCSELCGKDHAFMPIAVRVVNDAVFNEWVAAVKARDRNKVREIQERTALAQAGAKVADAASR